MHGDIQILPQPDAEEGGVTGDDLSAVKAECALLRERAGQMRKEAASLREQAGLVGRSAVTAIAQNPRFEYARQAGATCGALNRFTTTIAEGIERQADQLCHAADVTEAASTASVQSLQHARTTPR